MNGHLDAEAHSAALDGQATADEQGHLAGCPACRADVDRFAVVARAVGAPVPGQPSSEAESALARALAAAGPMSQVVPLASRRRWIDTRYVLASAAVLLVVALGATLADRATRSHSTTAAGSLRASEDTAAGYGQVATTLAPFGAGTGPGQPGPAQAAGGGAAGAAGPTTTSAASASPAGLPATLDGGDLGNQTAVGPLVTIVQAALDGERTTAPSPTGQPALAQPTAACAANAAAVSPVPLARLLYVATATWKGTPAIVLGEQAATDPAGRPDPSRIVLVLTRQGCGLLASQGF